MNYYKFVHSLIYFFFLFSKPIAEVKPTTTAVQPSLSRSTERKRSAAVPLKKPEKRPIAETGLNLTPFNEPQKALQLVSTQVNSTEW